MNVDTMPAGKQLDCAVAETVMRIDLRAVTDADIGRAVFSANWGNLPLYEKGQFTGRNEQPYKWNGREHRIIFDGSKFGFGGADGNNGYGLWCWQTRIRQPWQEDIEAHVAQWRRSVPSYSTDIAAAWTVVEHLRSNGFDAISLAIDNDIPGQEWRVMFSNGNRFYGEGETPMLAICRAALRAAEAPT